mmetsp:Transcript_64146/g.150365  ORF Transcript_64146/g.150365 Transcript_64146/m.150365 type:complete len:87 (+) Transcript_64146:806-1066(+)
MCTRDVLSFRHLPLGEAEAKLFSPIGRSKQQRRSRQVSTRMCHSRPPDKAGSRKAKKDRSITALAETVWRESKAKGRKSGRERHNP